MELCNILHKLEILLKSDIDNIDVRSQLEQQAQNEGAKDSGWRFDEILPKTKCI